MTATTLLCKVERMGRKISLELDENAEHALRSLESQGISETAAIRLSLIDAALRRGGPEYGEYLRAEMAEIDADAADRAEMRAVYEFMNLLCAEG